MRGRVGKVLHGLLRTPPHHPWRNSMVAVACAAAGGGVLERYLILAWFDAAGLTEHKGFLYTQVIGISFDTPLIFVAGLVLFAIFVLPALAVLLGLRLAGPVPALVYPVLTGVLLLGGTDRLLIYPLVASGSFVLIAYPGPASSVGIARKGRRSKALSDTA
ncbi:MAG: hypothetical protein AAFU65_05095 [Pseudomonadota bacterium]